MSELHRRTFLRGVGGAALALPFLSAMDVEADDELPRRFVVGFGGMSIGTSLDYVVPSATGAGYALTRGLAPLGDVGVQNEITIVSGLQIPWQTAGSIPPGGKLRNWHPFSLSSILAGVPSRSDGTVNGETSDQVVAAAIGGGTRFPRGRAYCVQAASYRGSNGSGGKRGRAAYAISGGNVVPIDPVRSPRAAWSTLTTGFAPSDPAEAARRDAMLTRRKSILDLVAGQRTALVSRLGAGDRIRLEKHFDEVRELERSLVMLEATGVEIPEDPGRDPALGGISAAGAGTNRVIYTQQGYSDEERRAEIYTQLVRFALATDQTRSISLMYTMGQCWMMMNDLMGYPNDAHQLSHSAVVGRGPAAIAAQMADIIAWHVKHFATLVAAIRDTDDGRGGSLLDHTALVLQFEGGRGYDPQTGKQNSSHSSQNMAALIAGRAGGLQPGRHVVAPASASHPAHVTTSAMRAVGVDPTLGEVGGFIPALFA